jgi:hypothetical protein
MAVISLVSDDASYITALALLVEWRQRSAAGILGFP